jgi:hypothetical protein
MANRKDVAVPVSDTVLEQIYDQRVTNGQGPIAAMINDIYVD